MPENSVLSRMKRKMSECSISRGTWMVVISLLLIFILAVFLRTYFGFDEATAYGTPYLVSGGSDSYYHERAINTAAYEHHSLLKDPMLNYPVGSRNPRPPAYDWSIVVMGYILAPFLGGNLASALSYSLIFSSVIWGSLTIFPVYLIGKKAFNRRVGIISAFLMATMPAHMQRSPLTYADHDPFVLFFVVSSIYFLLVALGKLKEKEWVDDWKNFGSIKKGFGAMARENRTSFLYAGLAGASSMTVALTWKGFSYLYLIVAIYFVIQLFINRFRNRDTLSLTGVSFFSLGMPLLLALPYYYASSQLTWLIAPSIMATGIILVGIYFSVTNRLPWTLTIPILAAILAFVGLITYFVSPSVIQTLGNQTGYFTLSKVYKTIAEAQAPYISNMIMSFGTVTFFMAILGIMWIIWKIRKNWEPSYVFFVIWSAVAIYMAVSAARFMFNASPAFAIAAAWITYYVIKEADFSSMKKTYRSLSGNKAYALKKSVKAKHVLVALFLVFMVVMPNVWYAVDAGIPSNEKKQYDLQVYDSMPEFMRPDSTLYNASSRSDLWYFGAFGYQLPTPNQYWPAAWSWFRHQDNQTLPEERPGFLSWWDYGFEAIQAGEHPAVADNFQNGYQIAGSFIMAQNETEAVSLFIERILDSEYDRHTGKFSERAIQLMHRYLTDEQVEKIMDIYAHPQSYVPEIQAHPEKYGPYDSVMNDLNARYVAARGVLQTYDKEYLVDMLKALEDMTGKRISYFAIDSRLVPFSAQNTGIFYAPAVLSDRRISEGNYRIPYDFYKIYAVTQYGKKYPIDEVPDDEKQNIDHTVIEYTDMFYNSMLYRNYFGYSPKEVGIGDNGLPGLSDNLKKNIPMPGWNLTHFRMVYRTAYWNPYTDYKNHTDAWKAVSLEEAMKHQKEMDGVVDMSPSTIYNGVTFLEYYDGAIVNGTVRTPEGEPVGNVRVTVYDDYGVPHQSVMTDENGHYSVIAPFGNTTLLVSNGGSLDKIRLSEKNILNSTQFHITKYQAWREKCDMNGDGKWDYLIEKNPVVSTSSITGNIFVDVNNNGANDGDESGVPASITIYGKNLEINYTVSADANGDYSITDVVPGDYGVAVNYNGFLMDMNVTVTIEPSKEATQNVAIPTGSMRGTARYSNGNYARDVEMQLVALDSQNIKNFTTEENGAYHVRGIIPGVYEVHIISDNFTAGNTRFAIPENRTTSMNITVYRGTRLSGYVTMNGKAVPDLGINFINYTDVLARRSVVTDENGYFSVKIPFGTYTVSATYISGDARYVIFKSIKADEPVMEKTFVLEKAYEVKGYIRYKIFYKDAFPVSFVRPDGARMNFYSVDGNYTAYLPADQYHAYVSYVFAGFPYAYSTWVDVPSEKRVNVDLLHGATIKGMVTGVENMPAIRARVDFRNNETGDVFETYTDNRGIYKYYLLPGNYTIESTAHGYTPHISYVRLAPADDIDHNITLTALKSEITGTVYLDGTPTPGVNITFYGYDSTYNTTTDDNGNYSIMLYGGRYTIIVSQYIDDEKKSKYELADYEGIYVNPYYEKMTKNLTIEKRYEVKGEVLLASGSFNDTYVVYFSNGTHEYPYHTRNGSFKVYLPVGKYIINSTASTDEGLFGIYHGIDVSGPINVSMDFKPAYQITVQTKVDGKKINGIPLNISVNGAVKTYKSDSDIAIFLPEGEYTFSVDYTRVETVENIDRNVTYSGTLSADISYSRVIELDLEKYVPEGSLTAEVYLDTNPVEETYVILHSEDSGQEYTFPISPGGIFTADVPMGAYVLYVSSYAGDNPYAAMDEVIIGEDTSTTIYLDEAVVFSGKSLKEDGTPIRSNISVINPENQNIQKQFETDENGSFSIVVPRGNYTVVATGSSEEYGIKTTYVKNTEIALTFSTDMNLVLERMNIYKPVLKWRESEKTTVAPGTDVTYHITVKNAGNTPDTYTFSSSIWSCDFDPESVSLQPGESASVTVIIHVPADALVNHDALTVVAESSESPSSTEKLVLDIGVKEVVGTEVGDIAESSWVDGNAIYGVQIWNTGNSPNTFYVAPKDRASLNAKGWDILLSSQKDGPYSNSAEIHVAANSSSLVYVKLIPLAEVPSYQVEFSLVSQSENGAKEEATLNASLPSIEIKSDITVSGENVALWNPKPMDMTPIYWAIAIVAALAAVYVIGRKKGVIL